MSCGYVGSMKAEPGMRDEVTIWTCAVWGTKEQHDSSRQLPGVSRATARAMPLIAGDFTQVDTDVRDGLGPLALLPSGAV